jgi:hypothetical protein
MKLSKLEQEGTKFQKLYKGATTSNTQETDVLVEIQQEIKLIKEILSEIRQKLDEKS